MTVLLILLCQRCLGVSALLLIVQNIVATLVSIIILVIIIKDIKFVVSFYSILFFSFFFFSHSFSTFLISFNFFQLRKTEESSFDETAVLDSVNKDDNENAEGDRYKSRSTCTHTRYKEENIGPEDFYVGVLIFSISLSVSLVSLPVYRTYRVQRLRIHIV